MNLPLVSVVTPTWKRHQLLNDRCIPSVCSQTYRPFEHIVIGDEGIVIPNVVDGGATPRRMGAESARGEIIAYLDDDNAYRPQHLTRLVGLLLSTGSDFAYSRMQMHGSRDDVIGSSPPCHGTIDTSLIVHRREILPGAWRSPQSYAGPHSVSPDWETVDHWLRSGARWAFLDEVTVDYWTGEPGGSRVGHA